MFFFFFDFSKYTLDEFLKHRLINKMDILNKIESLKETLDLESDFLNETLLNLLYDFSVEIQSKNFLDLSENLFWSYNIKIDVNGVFLYLIEVETNGRSEVLIKTSFELIKISPKMISTQEYAKINNVKDVTVRQWIRRGKLKGAIKIGNDWFISQLTRPVKKGFVESHYKWDTNLYDFIIEDININDFDSALIKKTKVTNIFQLVLCNSTTGVEKTISIKRELKEKIELYFVSNYMVEDVNSTIYCKLY